MLYIAAKYYKHKQVNEALKLKNQQVVSGLWLDWINPILEDFWCLKTKVQKHGQGRVNAVCESMKYEQNEISVTSGGVACRLHGVVVGRKISQASSHDRH